jgi:hypothetical protein
LQAADFPNKLSERLPQYKGRWQSSLADQIKDLPAFEQVVREVQRHLEIWECSRENKKHPVLTALYVFFLVTLSALPSISNTARRGIGEDELR